MIDIETPSAMHQAEYLQSMQGVRESSDDLIKVKQEVREEEIDEGKFAVAPTNQD